MEVIYAIMKFILGILDVLLPAIGVSDGFMTNFDNAVATVVSVINGVGYFIPLNTLLICLTTVFLLDNSVFLFNVGKFVIKLIRG